MFMTHLTLSVSVYCIDMDACYNLVLPKCVIFCFFLFLVAWNNAVRSSWLSSKIITIFAFSSIFWLSAFRIWWFRLNWKNINEDMSFWMHTKTPLSQKPALYLEIISSSNYFFFSIMVSLDCVWFLFLLKNKLE